MNGPQRSNRDTNGPQRSNRDTNGPQRSNRDMNGPQRSNPNNTTNVTVVVACAIASISINIACISIGATILTHRSAQKSKGAADQFDEEPIACVTCTLRPGDQLLKALAKRVDNGVQHCCAQDSAGMSALLELIMREPNVAAVQQTAAQLGHTNRTANFSLSVSSAHRRVMPAEEFDSAKYQTPLFTNESVPLLLRDETKYEAPTDHSREVNITDNSFQVIHPGVYYVYTNARYKPDSSEPCGNFLYQTWQQEVVKQSGKTRERTTIMKSIHTCSRSQTMDRESSFTGGVFKLEKGDHLELRSSGLGLISFLPFDSFFGLFMLDGGSRARLSGHSSV